MGGGYGGVHHDKRQEHVELDDDDHAAGVGTQEMFEEAMAQVGKKKGPPALPRLRLETYHEGPAVQIMHVGLYDAEGPTIAHMHVFIEENGYERAGKHHEI